ncbi:MAG: hypothetical protein JWR63_2102 [Conexibacter sp.]|nr:hypothetical protein [Conexibacter sp.]
MPCLGRVGSARYGEPVSPDAEPVTEPDIRALVARLSRPHRSGGVVIERAAIMAEGANSAAILRWIDENSWVPEEELPARTAQGGSGIHGMRREADRGRPQAQAPRRYVSPPGGVG